MMSAGIIVSVRRHSEQGEAMIIYPVMAYQTLIFLSTVCLGWGEGEGKLKS